MVGFPYLQGILKNTPFPEFILRLFVPAIERSEIMHVWFKGICFCYNCGQYEKNVCFYLQENYQ